uniref:Uncharacterized protein n=1 Tax=Anguilla anguilla TaxID=7936 RepID=A0A0E9TIM6_ANGAN
MDCSSKQTADSCHFTMHIFCGLHFKTALQCKLT